MTQDYDPPVSYKPPPKPYLIRWQEDRLDEYVIIAAENGKEALEWCLDTMEVDAPGNYQVREIGASDFMFSTKAESLMPFKPNWQTSYDTKGTRCLTECGGA